MNRYEAIAPGIVRAVPMPITPREIADRIVVALDLPTDSLDAGGQAAISLFVADRTAPNEVREFIIEVREV